MGMAPGLACALASVAALGLPSAAAIGGGCVGEDSVEDQVIVELLDGASIDTVLGALARQHRGTFAGVTVLVSLPDANAYLLAAPEPICELDLVAALQALPGVEEAELNENGESAEGQTQSFFFAGLPTDFADQYAWDLVGLDSAFPLSDGTGILVAIIDSGLDIGHPFLAGADILPGLDFVGDGQGWNDPADLVDNDGDGAIDEMAGHGTFLTGIIHAVAPGATILPLRAMDSEGIGNEFAIASALIEAMNHGADVINLSAVSAEDEGFVAALIEVARDNGIVVVVSAGNGGTKDNPPFPASLADVCAVAATDAADLRAPWSNVGTFVDVCGPGVDVVSAVPPDGYAFASGTSVATAFVSGSACLARALLPDATVETVLATLAGTATNIDALNPECAGLLGGGRLRVSTLVTRAAADVNEDGTVDGADLGALLGAWGSTDTALDLNGDGAVDGADLGLMLGAWGSLS